MAWTYPFVDPITAAQLLAALNADREAVLNGYSVAGTGTTYTSSTITAPANAQYGFFQLLAGGGPGGAGGGGAGGGGQAGGYTEGWMNVTAGDIFAATAGSSGGDSILSQNGTVIAHVVLGGPGAAGTSGAGGAGGGALGQVVVPLNGISTAGAPGQSGFVIAGTAAFSGAGGGSVLQNGAQSLMAVTSVNIAGYAAAYGAGGSGGVGSSAGGLGGVGLVQAYFFG